MDAKDITCTLAIITTNFIQLRSGSISLISQVNPTKMHRAILLRALSASSVVAVVSRDARTGCLPAMGWNSWNEYACNIDETVFVAVTQKLVALGLKDLGYEYVNIDDCWSDKQKRRDPKTMELILDEVSQGHQSHCRLIAFTGS